MKPAVAPFLFVLLFAASARAETRVPAWNQRGVGLLPWQGVACLEAAADGSQVVVGTIAPAGDPNVIVISRDGKILRDGKLPAEPTIRLPATQGRDWSYFAVGDYNGDRRPDVAYFTMPQEIPHGKVFYNTGKADAPFRTEPDATFDLSDPEDKKNQHPLLRDTVVAADWNGDGVTDLVVGKGQGNFVTIVPGGAKGLDAARAERITFDYRIHYETGLFVGDFNRDGKPDLAALGYTNTGVGAGGPLAVYIYLRDR